MCRKLNLINVAYIDDVVKKRDQVFLEEDGEEEEEVVSSLEPWGAPLPEIFDLIQSLIEAVVELPQVDADDCEGSDEEEVEEEEEEEVVVVVDVGEEREKDWRDSGD